MIAELLFMPHGEESRQRDKAALAPRETGPLPHVAIDDLFGDFGELGDKIADLFTVVRLRNSRHMGVLFPRAFQII